MTGFFRSSFLATLLILLTIELFPLCSYARAEQFRGDTKYLRYHVSYEVNPDGTHTETHEWALKVLRDQGISAANQASVSFSDLLANAEILQAYTLKQDGRRINVPPANFQEESNTGKDHRSPMFSDIRTKTVAFPDVAVGDTVVFAYKIEQHEATYPGNFSFLQAFSKFVVYDDVQVSLSTPRSLPMHVYKREVQGGEVPSTDGRSHWTWTYHNSQVTVPESYAVSPLDYGPLVIGSTFKDYGAVAAAYDARARPKAVPTDRIRQLATDLTKNAHNDRERAKVLYDWVATNIQYADNRAGIGSVVPHEAGVVLENRMGDCKDHAALLHSLLAAKGIRAIPVLINGDSAYSIPKVASVEFFDHIIIYIPSLNLYADPTSRFTAFGALPFGDSDKPVIPTEEFVEIEHTPSIDYRTNLARISTTMTVHPDGSADGETRIDAGGEWASKLRQYMAYLPPNQYDQIVRRALEQGGFGGSGKIIADDPKPLTPNYSYRVNYHLDDLMNLPGPAGMFIRAPLEGSNPMAIFLNGINDSDRTVNWECEGLWAREEYTIKLPGTVEVLAIPRNANVDGKLYNYHTRYERSGDTIKAVREVEDRTPVNSCTPADFIAQRTFAQSIKRDLRAEVLYQEREEKAEGRR